MSETLAEKTCTPCRGGIPPLTRDEAQRFQAQAPNWELGDNAHRIQRTFRFRNFREALAFVQAHSTAKCNEEIFGVEENLTRSSVAEYLSGARVEFILDPLDIDI